MNSGSSEPQVVLFERSPYGNIDAIVEHDDRTVYFYLASQNSFGMRSCWLGNLVEGPLVMSEADLTQGRPPLVPRIHCTHPAGREIPQESDLEIVWFEEGNGAAVLERGEVLGIIPPWSGASEFHGYARDSIAETIVAWPIPTETALLRRIEHAREFWRGFRDGNPFATLQSEILQSHKNRFGAEVKYWVIDNEQFPPRGLIQMESNGTTTFATVGMSLVPQPNVEMYAENPSQSRLVELAFQLDSSNLDPEKIEEIGQRISAIAKKPWESFTWFGHMHSCEFKVQATDGETPFVIFWGDPNPLCSYREDPVRLLWVVPITQAELDQLLAKDYSFVESAEFKNRLPV